MANSGGLLTEWDEGPQAATAVEPHWFGPILTNADGNTIVTDPYTTDYGSGSPPWNVTLTDTAIGSDGQPGATIPVASYATGYNFHIASASLADGSRAIFYTTANGTYPQSSAVDINVQRVDAQGNPIGEPVTLQSAVEDVRQFRVGSAALDGKGYVLTWATVTPQSDGSNLETVYYQGYTANGTPRAGDGGVIDSFGTTTTSGESYGFGTLQTGAEADPSFIYLRGSNHNGDYPNNVGVKYKTVSTDGQSTGFLSYLAPPYPGKASSPDLLNFSYDRLTPTAGSGNDLALIMRYSYNDVSGATHQEIDVRTMNVESGAGTDHVITLASGDTSSNLTETVLANGDLAVGYGDGTNDAPQVQVFTPNGVAVGSPVVLPAKESGFSLTTNDAGQLVVEWTANVRGGQQLKYDLYDVGNSGPSSLSVAVDPMTAGFVNGETPVVTGTISDPSGTAGIELFSGDPANGGQDLGAAAVNGDGIWTFQGNIGAGDFSDITAVATNAKGRTASATAPYELVTGVTGASYRAIEYDFAPDGGFGYTEYAKNGDGLVYGVDNGDGTHSVYATANRQSLQSIGHDTMTGGGVAERFVFTPGFGQDEITDFVAGGPQHDTVDLSQTQFTSLVQVLHHTTMAGGSATIHLGQGDAVTLDGITKAELKVHAKDFAFA